MNTYLLIKTLFYTLSAKHKRGHGIHSPFVYDLIRNVFIDNTKYAEYGRIESVRSSLLLNASYIDVVDMGAGSQIFANVPQRRVRDIASSSLSPAKYAQLLFRLVRYLKPQHVLEMGTSLGISGAYLSMANLQALVFTLEGSPAIVNIAENTFRTCGAHNVRIVQGNFSHTLLGVLSEMKQVDLAFIDGNHQKQATLDYFEAIVPYCNEQSILVFDDIYWSKGMTEAWNAIKADTRVSITIDICKFGIVFFRSGVVKQDFIISY